MPPLVLEIIGYIQLAMKAAPYVKEIYDDGKALIDRMLRAGLITVEQANTLHKWSDDHMNATLRGEIPLALTVEPDPTPTSGTLAAPAPSTGGSVTINFPTAPTPSAPPTPAP